MKTSALRGVFLCQWRAALRLLRHEMAFGIFVLGTIHLHVFCKIDGGLLRFVAVPAAKQDVRLFTGFAEL